tara:strand:- start:10867 stop:11886 length:1020 start_codon:yes stop_codon:yes gene_type:complete
MFISEVSISNIRATKNTNIKFLKGINLLYGKNGAGKTTILETLFLLLYGKSFKTSQTKDFIGSFEKNSGAALKTSLENRIKIEFFDQKKRITNDGFKIKKLSDHISFLPCLVFSPDETTIEGKNNSQKQTNINKVLSIINKEYLENFKKYNIALKQRNAALKTGKNFNLWDENIISLSKKIWNKKQQHIKNINQEMEKVNKNHNTQIKTNVEIKGPKTNTEEIKEDLKKSKEKDMLNKRTNVGPQTDKIKYTINDKSVKTKASQGEKNLFFSVLKKAESIIVEKETKKDPIILLDDIFSKLDSKNTNLVLSLFKENPQTIITHTKKIENQEINQIQIDA